jgi:hypothetical protein
VTSAWMQLDLAASETSWRVREEAMAMSLPCQSRDNSRAVDDVAAMAGARQETRHQCHASSALPSSSQLAVGADTNTGKVGIVQVGTRNRLHMPAQGICMLSRLNAAHAAHAASHMRM